MGVHGRLSEASHLRPKLSAILYCTVLYCTVLCCNHPKTYFDKTINGRPDEQLHAPIIIGTRRINCKDIEKHRQSEIYCPKSANSIVARVICSGDTVPG